MIIEMINAELRRHKLRTTLTIIGIIIGILLVTTMVSFSEGLRASLNEQIGFVSGMVTVVQKGTDFQTMMTSEFDKNIADQISELDGVEKTLPVIFFTVDGIPIIGVNLEGNEDMFPTSSIGLESGREHSDNSLDEVSIGNSIARRNDYGIGDEIELRGKKYTVVGIWKETGSTEDDNGIAMSLDAARDLWGREDRVSMVLVKPYDLSKAENIAEDINKEFGDDVEAYTDKDLQREAASFITQISTMTYAVGGIAAIISGVVIMNVMFMSVRERRRQIGAMKAIGATDTHILLEILGESILISTIGGVIGLLLSVIAIYLIDTAAGYTIAKLTFRLVITSISFAVILGVLGGVLPARRAAKISPIEALRYE